MVGNFSWIFCHLHMLFNITFIKIFLGNSIRMSNSLDSDQAGHSVESEQGLNCLQRSSVDNRI